MQHFTLRKSNKCFKLLKVASKSYCQNNNVTKDCNLYFGRELEIQNVSNVTFFLFLSHKYLWFQVSSLSFIFCPASTPSTPELVHKMLLMVWTSKLIYISRNLNSWLMFNYAKFDRILEHYSCLDELILKFIEIMNDRIYNSIILNPLNCNFPCLGVLYE